MDVLREPDGTMLKDGLQAARSIRIRSVFSIPRRLGAAGVEGKAMAGCEQTQGSEAPPEK